MNASDRQHRPLAIDDVLIAEVNLHPKSDWNREVFADAVLKLVAATVAMQEKIAALQAAEIEAYGHTDEQRRSNLRNAIAGAVKAVGFGR